MHLFRTGVAILTVETLHDPCASPLTLAQAQTIIDHFRRSYTPYWNDGKPQMVPLELGLSNGVTAETQHQDDMMEFLEDNRETGADAKLLEPWKSWISPLTQADWRNPSDERVPAMSLVLLEKNRASNRETLDQIEDKDWYRLAEADESGADYAYNPAFLKELEGQFFYDRFRPDDKMPDYLATRHIFGGAHYCVVSVDDEFSRETLQTHFRRHYEKMALIARFEFASLLAFSSRITALVKTLESTGSRARARRRFRAEILTLHGEFLEYTHRYRFTGISSQIQATEMFAHWRASLGLDQLYRDVKDEITSAAEFSHAILADEKATQGNRLSVGAFLVGGVLGAAALLDFTLFRGWVASLTETFASRGWDNPGPLVEFLTPVIPVALLAVILYWWSARSR